MTNNTVRFFLNDKQVEFLVKCIDITQETHSIKPDRSEAEVIRKLTNIQQDIEDDKVSGDLKFLDLN